MVTTGPGERLLGRRVECGVLDRLLVAAREGHGGALVVHGQPGVGKTALLDFAIASADRFGSRAPSASNRRWSCRFRLCNSYADRCWIDSTFCRVLSGRGCGWRSD